MLSKTQHRLLHVQTQAKYSNKKTCKTTKLQLVIQSYGKCITCPLLG